MDERRQDPAEESRPERTAEEISAVGAEHAEEGSPLGGDDTTQEQLDADIEVEEDTLKTLNPDDPA